MLKANKDQHINKSFKKNLLSTHHWDQDMCKQVSEKHVMVLFVLGNSCSWDSEDTDSNPTFVTVLPWNLFSNFIPQLIL